MDLALFWSVFVALGIIYFAIGMHASRSVATEEDYFLANRQFGPFAITFALVATQLGAGMILGTAEESYHFGLYGIIYNLGICLGFLLLGFGFAAKLRAFNITTTAQLFEIKYNSTQLRRFASLLSIITLGGILSGQILASRTLMTALIGDYDWVITLFWLTVIFYTMFGGLRAVVATDIFQVFVILIIFGGVFAYSIFHHGFGHIQHIPDYLLQKSSQMPHGHNFSRLFGFLLMPMLFSLIEQDLAQRFFSAKNKRTAVTAAFLSAGIILLFSLIPMYFGIKARGLTEVTVLHMSPLIATVKHLGIEIFLIIVVCGLIAAISSTADSLLCAIGSNIVSDFKLDQFGILLSRIVTVIVGISALILSYHFDNILDIVTQSYEISVSCLFIPIVFCFFKRKWHTHAATFAITFGFMSFIIFHVWPISWPHQPVTLALSLLGFFIGERYGQT